MPGGQALMCVWQAVAAADPSLKDRTPTSQIRHISMQFARPPEFKYTESAFQSTFPGDTVDFETYKDYVTNRLVSKTCPQPAAEEIIEKHCWDICRKVYNFGSSSPISSDSHFKLWQMFNRICVPGSCPPTVEVTDMNWFANKIAVPIKRRWADLSLESSPLTFVQAYELLVNRVFGKDSGKESERSIDQLHAWLVREVSMTGWLYKRTRKQSNNWTTWQRRFCVLTPGEIRYFTSANQREKDFKGKVAVGTVSRLEALNDFKSLTRKYPNRFRVSNQPIIELELSALEEHEKKGWLSALEEVISAAKAGTTPVQAVLAERLAQHKRGQPKQDIGQAMSRLKSSRLSKVPDTLDLEQFKEIPAKPKAAPIHNSQSSNSDDDGDDEEEIFDNNTYSFEKTKVREIFNQIDTDKNGTLNEREFDEFLRVILGRSTDAQGTPAYLPIFEEIVEDGDRVIEFEEFYAYFTRLMLTQHPDNDTEAALKAEFMNADSDGVGTVDFKDLAEFVWDRRRSFRYRKLLDTLDKSPGKREAWCPIFTGFVQIQYGGDAGFGETFLNAEELFKARDALGEQIRGGEQEQLMEDVAEELSELWQQFTTDKNLRSTDPDRIAARYNLIDVACYFTTRGQKPPMLSVDAARWDADVDRTLMILPAGASVEVPVVDATDAYLQYYGCRLADLFHERVALFYEHRIENFGYYNQGFADLTSQSGGGPGLEKSSFSRFDCPLSASSGQLVIARWEGDEETLEVTAFRLPRNTSIYIPAGTMYSLDYTDGSWRTIKRNTDVTEHAQLRKQFTEGNDNDLQKVTFTFI